jgi:hypothetical protein
MVPDDSPLAILAHQGPEAANLVVIEKSIGVPRREPSVSDNTAMNGMTFTTLLKIRGISGLEHHPHHDGLRWGTLLWWEKVDSVLWRDHSDKFGGQTNSRLETSTGMMAPATLKNLFRCIKSSLRPLEEMIG